MIRINTTPLTPDQLQTASTPSTALDGETIAWSYWDTQTYPTAGQQTTTFFSTIQSDKSLGNIPLAGSLPNPYWLAIQYFTLDFLGTPSNTAAQSAGTANTGLANDLYNLLFTGKMYFNFTLADKLYAQFPATGLHSSGGPLTFATGAFVAATNQEYCLNSVPDGDLYIGGSIIIPPMQVFSAQLVTNGTIPTVTTALAIRLTMWGSLTRRVL
jgi:hypothetical protein